MGFISTLIIGLLVGLFAKVVMRRPAWTGVLMTLGLSTAGAFVAGYLGLAVGLYSDPQGIGGLIASTAGALVLLAIYRRAVAHRMRQS